jgi:hypothetical protein
VKPILRATSVALGTASAGDWVWTPPVLQDPPDRLKEALRDAALALCPCTNDDGASVRPVPVPSLLATMLDGKPRSSVAEEVEEDSPTALPPPDLTSAVGDRLLACVLARVIDGPTLMARVGTLVGAPNGAGRQPSIAPGVLVGGCEASAVVHVCEGGGGGGEGKGRIHECRPSSIVLWAPLRCAWQPWQP